MWKKTGLSELIKNKNSQLCFLVIYVYSVDRFMFRMIKCLAGPKFFPVTRSTGCLDYGR